MAGESVFWEQPTAPAASRSAASPAAGTDDFTDPPGVGPPTQLPPGNAWLALDEVGRLSHRNGRSVRFSGAGTGAGARAGAGDDRPVRPAGYGRCLGPAGRPAALAHQVLDVPRVRGGRRH